MPLKDKERRRIYKRAWYARIKHTPHQRGLRRERRRRQRANRGKKNAELLHDIKAQRGCLVCMERDPVTLMFHHREEKLKSFVLCGGAIDLRSTRQILAEVAKCDVLCANCHLDAHFQRRRDEFVAPSRSRRGSLVAAFLRGDLDGVDP